MDAGAGQLLLTSAFLTVTQSTVSTTMETIVMVPGFGEWFSVGLMLWA